MRYLEIEGDSSLDPRYTPITGYGERAGVNLPVNGQVVWNLPFGDLLYVDSEITEITYNFPNWPRGHYLKHDTGVETQIFISQEQQDVRHCI